MKKILLSLFAFVAAFVLFASFSSKVKADAPLTDEKIIVEGASIKTSGDTGLKFVGNIDDYEVPAGRTITKYGFVIAVTEAPASDDFVIGGTVDGNPTSAIEMTELDANKKFNLVILNIPEAQVGFNLSARAYVRLDDDTVVYGTESTVRNMLQVAIAAVESGELDPSSLAVVETIITTSENHVKKYFTDSLGSLYVDNSVFESDPVNLYISFARAWNTTFATEIAAGTVNAIDEEAANADKGDELKNALQGTLLFDKEANIVKFFVQNYETWGWFLDFFSYGGGNPEHDLSLVRQCALIKECYDYKDDPSHVLTEISINDWYKANNLITYIADYFTQTNYSAFGNNEEYGIVYFTEDDEAHDYAPKGNDYRTFFATILASGFNNKVNAINANYVGVGNTLVVPATAEHVGYTGYYYNAADPGEELEVGAEYTVTDSDVQFLRAYRLTNYTVTYNLNAADATNAPANPATYTIKTAEITLAAATRTGYTFDGWFTDSELTKKLEKIQPGSADGKDHADITLYAKWSANPNTVNYHLNGSAAAPAQNNAGNPVTVETDAVVTLLDPTRLGHIFAGWFKDSALTQPLTDSKLTGAVTMDVYAKWSAINYVITYNLNGGTNAAANPASYKVESTIAFANATKTGYTFAGWYTDAEFTTAKAGIAPGETGALALYAKWTLDTYTITYNLNGGTNSANNPATYTYESEAITLEDASKTGYTFAGWYSDSGLTVASNTIAANSTGNKTFYAKWTAIPYDITYNLNGGTNGANPATYTIETAFTFLNATKNGYSFAGWYTDAEFTTAKAAIAAGETGALELFAKWTLDTHTITYNLNGGTNSADNPATFTFESDVITLADPTKAGYDFQGWFKENTFVNQVTEIATGTYEDVVLYAKFNAGDVEITFDHNDSKTLMEAWDQFRADVIAACVAHSFAEEYRANFLTQSRMNQYYYDYLPLQRVLQANWPDCDAIRTNYAWLFTLIGSVADDRVAAEIAGFNTRGTKSADSVYVFCQEFKNCYYVAMGSNDQYGYTSASLTVYEMYDWVADEDKIMDQLRESTKSADSVQTLTVDTLISYVPTRLGFDFAGWNTKLDGSGSTVTTVPTDDTTLYAMWTPVAP